MRVTPEEILELDEDEIFVFGSNESGIHGAGAAKFAAKFFGAQHGYGFGPTGQTFAIPTKDWDIVALPLSIIEFYVKRFIQYAELTPNNNFLVTAVGCGLAGFTPEDIAPFFQKCLTMKNVYLPQVFLDVLQVKEEVL